jgi:hypothetical protein
MGIVDCLIHWHIICYCANNYGTVLCKSTIHTTAKAEKVPSSNESLSFGTVEARLYEGDSDGE